MTLTVGSLFSGIGGLELGFERAGFEIAWQVEIDPWCRRVLNKHWPDVPKYEDVRMVGVHNLEHVDVLVGGFPCQDISTAGKKAGIDGERSGLWREYTRLVGELRPRYVVVENVANLLSNGMGRVLGDLAACRYDAEWECLPAISFGAPHRRDRVFIVAYPARNRCDGRFFENEHERERQEMGRRKQSIGHGSDGHLAHTERPRLEGRTRPRIFGASEFAPFREGTRGFWEVEPSVGRVVDGLPSRVDRLRGLGNAVVPQVAQYVAECVKAHAMAALGDGA